LIYLIYLCELYDIEVDSNEERYQIINILILYKTSYLSFS
jgi:hypothetical protein